MSQPIERDDLGRYKKLKRPADTCECGKEIKIHLRSDPRVCDDCDLGNRYFILRLALLLGSVDLRTSEFLVLMSGYKTELSKA